MDNSEYLLTERKISKTVYSHQYSRDYNILYPSSNSLFYQNIESNIDSNNQDSVVIKIYFKHTYSNFKEYVFKLDDSDKHTSIEDFFIFKFDKNATKNTFKKLSIDILTTNNQLNNYSINVSYDPKIVNDKSGRSSSINGFYIHETDIPFSEISSDKFIVFTPSELEKKAVRKEFGNGINNGTLEEEKIKILAKNIMNELEENRGIPSDSMIGLSPMEQYYRVKENKDKVWCGNIAYLFTYVCTCFDIPVRIIGLGNTFNSKSDPVIYHADHHTLTEVYNKTTKKWQVMDLTFYMLNTINEEGQTLNFMDFWNLLNIPQEREKLQINSYNAKKQITRQTPILEVHNYNTLIDYYKQNQKGSFPYKTENGVAFFSF